MSIRSDASKGKLDLLEEPVFCLQELISPAENCRYITTYNRNRKPGASAVTEWCSHMVRSHSSKYKLPAKIAKRLAEEAGSVSTPLPAMDGVPPEVCRPIFTPFSPHFHPILAQL